MILPRYYAIHLAHYELQIREQEFLRLFKEKQYRPELLFEDDDILSRISRHPMELWKCSDRARQVAPTSKPGILAKLRRHSEKDEARENMSNPNKHISEPKR